MKKNDGHRWLPTTLKEVRERNWDTLDVILFSGDAYIDHPSFGVAVIGRLLEREGLKVAVVPQPNWQDDLRDFRKLGRPRLFFGVTAGAMDSMVNHYTANKRLRSNDAYTPGGKHGFRPDYPTVVYTRILKELFPEVPVVIGGIEASLRRFTHYDYWQDHLRPSFLVETGADLLLYGMAEKALVEVVRTLESGLPASQIMSIPQTACLQETFEDDDTQNTIVLHSHEQCLKSKQKFAENFRHIEEESNKMKPARLVQPVGERFVSVNPPFETHSEMELDALYDLPYTRLPHPKYRNKGDIPAYEMIRHSITVHRGCFGGCSFCTISAHQGKFIASRSADSVLKEVEAMKATEGFSGVITDLGGPSANMYQMQGRELKVCMSCKRPSCIYPGICHNLNTSHQPMLDLYHRVEQVEGVNKVFIGSGIRYDLLMTSYNTNADRSIEQYKQRLITRHVSGRLKVAPEHTAGHVLKAMRKPPFELFKSFHREFHSISSTKGIRQQLIPYFISNHPACHESDMAELAVESKQYNMKLEQVQGFTPTPMTLATVMHYTGLDPYTMKPVFTDKSPEARKRQHMYFFWYKPEYRQAVSDRLLRLNRKDLLRKL